MKREEEDTAIVDGGVTALDKDGTAWHKCLHYEKFKILPVRSIKRSMI